MPGHAHRVDAAAYLDEQGALELACQPLQPGRGERAQVEIGLGGDAELERQRAQRVVPCAGHPSDQSLVAQAGQQTVHGGAVQRAVLGQIGQAPADLGVRRQQPQQPYSAAQRPRDAATGSGASAGTGC